MSGICYHLQKRGTVYVHGINLRHTRPMLARLQVLSIEYTTHIIYTRPGMTSQSGLVCKIAQTP